MNDFVTFIKDLGFPMFVAIYMLTENSRNTKELTKAIAEVREALIGLKDHCLIKGGNE